MFLQAFLIGLIAAFGHFDYALGTTYLFRPITLAPLVGLVLGDLSTGVQIGASLELLFMGAISVGAYLPPNVTIGGVLATAFAISLNQGVETAVALAMPIAVLSIGLENILNTVLPMFLRIADEGAAEGNDKKIYFTHWIMGIIHTALHFLLVFFAFWLGADAVQNMLDFIPEFILDGLGTAAGILPAMGFAMLMRMIISKRLLPYFFLGFIFSAYLELPVLGVAIIAIILAIEKFKLFESNTNEEGLDYEEEF